MAQIRGLLQHEAEQVLALWNENCIAAGTPLPDKALKQILKNLRQYASHKDAHCLVAEEQNKIIGFVTFCVTSHPVMPGLSGEIEELYVQPQFRRNGIGSELVKRAVALMKAQNAGSIHVKMCINNEGSKAFWQHLGWDSDMLVFSIYSDVPGDPQLQSVWDAITV